MYVYIISKIKWEREREPCPQKWELIWSSWGSDLEEQSTFFVNIEAQNDCNESSKAIPAFSSHPQTFQDSRKTIKFWLSSDHLQDLLFFYQKIYTFNRDRCKNMRVSNQKKKEKKRYFYGKIGIKLDWWMILWSHKMGIRESKIRTHTTSWSLRRLQITIFFLQFCSFYFVKFLILFSRF